jgi:hypothetical protein
MGVHNPRRGLSGSRPKRGFQNYAGCQDALSATGRWFFQGADHGPARASTAFTAASYRQRSHKSRLNSRTQSAILLGGVVDCQGQRAAHPDIVEQLPLVVQGDQASAAPITFLNGQLATESGSKLVALFLAENYGTRAARSLQIAPTRVDRLSAKIPVKPSR